NCNRAWRSPRDSKLTFSTFSSTCTVSVAVATATRLGRRQRSVAPWAFCDEGPVCSGRASAVMASRCGSGGAATATEPAADQSADRQPRAAAPSTARRRRLAVVSHTVLNAVIGRFLRNRNVMGVTLPHAGRRYLDKLRVVAQLFNVSRAAVTHPRSQ